MVAVGVVLLVFTLVCLVWMLAMCRMARPFSEEDRAKQDDLQARELAEWPNEEEKT